MDSYLIDKYEVSNEKFGRFMKETRHPAPAYWDDPRLNKPHHPVVGVNFFDAQAFCKWEGKRLPTEAEWEHAARGAEGNRYPWGNDFDSTKANFGNQHKSTKPVDSYAGGRSPYGIYNMAGNAFEWVSDWYDPHYYQKSPHPPNPQGPEKPVWLGGTGTYVDRLTVGEKRVIRGGSWIASEKSITTTHRFWNHPSNNSYGVGLGFRCAMKASPAIENHIKSTIVDAMKSMGKERYQEAGHHVKAGLKIDPTNKDLLRLERLIHQSM
jgi:formylglycine-generating enzyme required for sulfatase activity